MDSTIINDVLKNINYKILAYYIFLYIYAL
jgi:hypothetical protein